MGRVFRLRKEVALDATREQVWDAVATGPGLSSWFMGPHEIEPWVGGTVTLTIGDFSERATITAWEPPHRLRYRGDAGPDGTFHAMEFLIEDRGDGATVLRFVHSGFLGDGWGAEYEELTSYGWDVYLHTLAQYVTYFTGRPGIFVYAQGPPAPEGQDAWTVLMRGLGLTGPVSPGDQVRLTPDGPAPIDGVVDYADPGFREFLGIRSGDALYRFHGGTDQISVGHHLFDEDADGAKAAATWQAWLTQLFTGHATGSPASTGSTQ